MIVGMAVETTVASKEASAVTRMSATVTARRRCGSKRGGGGADMSAKAYRTQPRRPDADRSAPACLGYTRRGTNREGFPPLPAGEGRGEGGISPSRARLGRIFMTRAQYSHLTVPSDATSLLLDRPQLRQFHSRLT